jgi:hypothetical protein
MRSFRFGTDFERTAVTVARTICVVLLLKEEGGHCAPVIVLLLLTLKEENLRGAHFFF